MNCICIRKSKKKSKKLTEKDIIKHNRKLSRQSLTPGPYIVSPRRKQKSKNKEIVVKLSNDT
jgi:hypothetical protein